MARYRVTFEIEARDRADAAHWATWLLGWDHVLRDLVLENIEKVSSTLTVVSPRVDGETERPRQRDG